MIRCTAILVVLLALAGCATERDKAVADSAASAWEAADAIEKGVDPALAAEAIKKQVYAIIRAMGFDYAPAKGVAK